MNRLEHLLTILGEECAEVVQMTSKSKRFGLHECMDKASNAERLQVEYNHIIALIDMINDEDMLVDLHRDQKLIRIKTQKVERYLLYSKKCGTLQDDVI